MIEFIQEEYFPEYPLQKSVVKNEAALAAGLSVVIPAYNSQGSLKELVQRLIPVLSTLTESFEVIIVNDGSQDGTWATIQELIHQNDCISGVNLMRNFGQHNALLCGIREAHYDTILTIDDDLQHPPEEIVRLLAELEKGFDVVYGTPQQESHGLFRDLASQVTKLALQSSMGAQTARQVSAFRIFRTRVRDAFAGYQGPHPNIDVLLTWGTTRFSSVVVTHEPRRIGQSAYSLYKLVIHAMNLITGFSVLPLQIASIVGFFFTLFGVIIFIYAIVNYIIRGGAVPGFTFLASIISIFSGAQLFALGIVGEYLARMHFRVMDRPTYVVQEKISMESAKERGG